MYKFERFLRDRKQQVRFLKKSTNKLYLIIYLFYHLYYAVDI